MANCNEKAAGSRDQKGRFRSGNPGRPKGTRHKVTVAAQELLDADGKALTRKAVEMALGGDTVALRLCLERICPPRKDSPVEFDLPDMKCAHDAGKAAGSILEATADGILTPLEAASIMTLVEGYRRALESSEFEQRITAIEESVNGKPHR